MANAEADWIVSLDSGAKARFLASLSHQLTVAGRDSYVVQGNGLTKPEFLRLINEIQHRVSACLSELLSGERTESFERSIAGWVLECPDEDVRTHAISAWKFAKGRVQRAN